MGEASAPAICQKHQRQMQRDYHADSPHTGGGMLSAKELKALEVPFGKKSASKIRTVRDMDNHLAELARKYPHFAQGGGIGRPSKDWS